MKWLARWWFPVIVGALVVWHWIRFFYALFRGAAA